MQVGRLLFPGLRWNPSTGFDHEAETIETALELGVGGFIIFGGETSVVRALTTELQERSSVPLLFGSDLERGAGQQFSGATPLPPLAAIGALDDLEATRWAGKVTGQEARSLGIGWVYAPNADLDIEPRNPIVGTRALGADPDRVAEHVVAWIEGCHEAGALSCVKHFPGHGRSITDSHVETPTIHAPREVLETEDLEPFRAAIRAHVDTVMTAHVAYPALDPTGTPATLSTPIIRDLLRGELSFDGLVVTDALIMEGVTGGGRGVAQAAVDAVAAGCDVLLYVHELRSVVDALTKALGNELTEDSIAESIRRIDRAIESVEATDRETSTSDRADTSSDESRHHADELALRALQPQRGSPVLGSGVVRVVTVDDDVGGPYAPPARDAFLHELREGGLVVMDTENSTIDDDGAHSTTRQTVIALYADIRGWKGHAGVSEKGQAAVARAVAEGKNPIIVLFGHPRLAAKLPGDAPILAAWGGEPLMQRAAARWLLQDQ